MKVTARTFKINPLLHGKEDEIKDVTWTAGPGSSVLDHRGLTGAGEEGAAIIWPGI